MSDTIERILVATDFSECSKAALRRGSVLAKALGAALDVIHVWAYRPAYAAAMVGSGPPEDAVRKLASAASEQMRSFCAEASESGVEIANQLVLDGDAGAEVVRVAEEGGYDLIVAGTHGRKAVPRFFMGSVAERIVRNGPCPVLTVRHHG
jgi:universal stress protein A